MDWMQEPLNFIPNFHHQLIFDCVVPHCMHLTSTDLIICFFISGKQSFLFSRMLTVLIIAIHFEIIKRNIIHKWKA